MRLLLISFLGIIIAGTAVPDVQAISITERAGNHYRTAANNQEFTLNKNNVNPQQFGLLRTYPGYFISPLKPYRNPRLF
ncbi:hypothetical protein [Methylomarinum vadi]|uniref:hypothetical protein n=1 Tax=Methylomarinum vadi TaxID=438855 RepID=UPI0004DF65AB|nr:hypothetical protein [Methylomarinum vadi]